jgi:hypothetical protein
MPLDKGNRSGIDDDQCQCEGNSEWEFHFRVHHSAAFS